MNFLAHLYLSGNDREIMFGNFIGDAVKNNDFELYPNKIKEGILLHRAIDFFTDNNSTFKMCCEVFRPIYSKYSCVVTDIVFDYFLANNWNRFSNFEFRSYVDDCYCLLKEKYELIPAKFKPFVENFIKNDRLGSYLYIEQIKNVLEKMSIYRGLPNVSADFIKYFMINECLLKNNFFDFFEQAKIKFCR